MEKNSKNNDMFLNSSTVFICFFFIGLIIYLPVLNADPLWDDWIYIFKSLALKTVSPIEFWKLGEYRRSWPLFYTVLSFMRKVWEVDVYYYHLTSVLLHVVNSFFLFKILKKLGGHYGLLLALLYLVHPLHFFTVSWIMQLKTLMCIFFFLVSLNFFLGNEIEKSPLRYWSSVLFFGLSLFSKAAFAPIILLMPLFNKKKIKLLPFAFLCLYSTALTTWNSHLSDYVKTANFPFISSAVAQDMMSHQAEKIRPMGPPQKNIQYSSDRFALTLNNFSKYAVFVIYPWDTLLVHPMTLVTYSFESLIASIFVFFMCALLIFKYWEQKDFVSLSGFLFFLVSILPLCGLFYIHIFRYSNFVEYWLSVPLLGLILCASQLKERKTVTVLFALLALFFGVRSFQMARLNSDPVSVINRSMEKSPQNSNLSFVLAKHYYFKDDFKTSIKVLEATRKYITADQDEIESEININRIRISGKSIREYTP